MAVLKQLPKDRWFEYFEAFTKNFLTDANPEAAEVEVVSPDLGDQIGVKQARVLGITYDRHKDSLEFAFEGGDHRIANPQEIWVQEDGNGFAGLLEVVRPDETREIIRMAGVGVVPARG
ncbi:MAG: DUF5335 family protein [Gemmatimonadota bacterium]